MATPFDYLFGQPAPAQFLPGLSPPPFAPPSQMSASFLLDPANWMNTAGQVSPVLRLAAQDAPVEMQPVIRRATPGAAAGKLGLPDQAATPTGKLGTPESGPVPGGPGEFGPSGLLGEPAPRRAPTDGGFDTITTPAPQAGDVIAPGFQVGMQPFGQQFGGPAGTPRPAATGLPNIDGLPWGQPGGPVALRFNNPGAIEFGDFARRYGAVPGDDNPRYAKFPDAATGWRAMQDLLRIYMGGQGRRTLTDIISRWAPAPENDVDAYVKRVAAQLGLPENATLTEGDIPALARAMFSVESGVTGAQGAGPPAFRPTEFVPGAATQELTAAGVPQSLVTPGPGALGQAPLAPGMGQARPSLRPSDRPSPYAAPQPPPNQGSLLARMLGVTPAPVAGSGWDFLMGAPSGNAFLGRRQQSAAAIFARGQQLRAENPDATPDSIMRLLMRDPVWGQNAINLGTQGPAILRAAIQPLPPQEGAFTIGATRYDASGRPIVTGQLPPPDAQRLAEWFMGLSPQQQQQYMAFRASQQTPSDREQAIARIERDRLAGRQANFHDLHLAGYLVRVPLFNDARQVIGDRVFDFYNQRYLSPDEEGRLPPIPPGGPPATVGPPQGGPPGAPPVAPGVSAPAPVGGPPPPPAGAGQIPPGTQAPSVPGIVPTGQVLPAGVPTPPERLAEGQAVMEQFGLFEPGANSPVNMFNAAAARLGGQMAGMRPGATFEGQRPAQQGTVELGPSPDPFLARARRYRRADGTEFDDVPEVSVRTPVLSQPETMFMGVGVGPVFTRMVSRFVAQVPGFETSDEANQARGVLMDRLGAAFARLQEGARLSGEYAATQATVPSSSDFRSNPVRALNQAIELRRGLIDDLRLATTSNLPIASERAQRIRAVLSALPTMEAMLELRDKVRRGESPAETLDVPGLALQARQAAGKAAESAGGPGGESDTTRAAERSLPEDLTGLPLSVLTRLRGRPNLPPSEILRLQSEVERRIRARATTKSGQ